jgi:phage antirepressor YoqD-like protein
MEEKMKDKKETLTTKLQELYPALKFYQDIVDASGLFSMKEAGSILGYGPNKLFRLLREKCVFKTKSPAKNLPYQIYIDRKYFKVKLVGYICNGRQHLYRKTYVTGKGLTFLQRLIDTKEETKEVINFNI